MLKERLDSELVDQADNLVDRVVLVDPLFLDVDFDQWQFLAVLKSSVLVPIGRLIFPIARSGLSVKRGIHGTAVATILEADCRIQRLRQLLVSRLNHHF